MGRNLILLAGCAVLAACSGQTHGTPSQPDAGGVAAGGSASSGGKGGAPEPCCLGGEPAETPPGQGGAGAEADLGPISVGGFEDISNAAVWRIAPGCSVAVGAPDPAGPFAAPAVVWSRVSRFVFDEEVEPLSPLPTETTPKWAGNVALQALDTAQQRPGGAPGLRRFLTRWLDVDRSSIFEQDWPALLAGKADATNVLFTTPLLERGRVGIFTEVPFLTAHPSISERGLALLEAWRGQPVPLAPPPHPPLVPSPGQTRRTALEEIVKPPACAVCHHVADAVGLSLEHFDELGHYRDLDAGMPVDSSGSVAFMELDVDLPPAPLDFTGIDDLVPQIAPLCTTAVTFAHACQSDALLAAGLMDIEPEPNPPKTPQSGALDDDGVAYGFLVHGKTYRSLVWGIAQSRRFLD
jgi:hypothetical protein